jgi:hypothetical protein
VPLGGAYIPSAFDIFVLAMSVLSIVNMALAIALLRAAVHNVVLIVDRVLCVRELGERS